jgi:hypothetical protein
LSEDGQVLRRGLSRPSIGHDFERNLLSFIKAIHAGALNRADVHKHVLAAIIRLNEAEAFLAVEPFHGSLHHVSLLSE